MMTANGEPNGVWHVWVDTGGTFTDCLARDPQGELHRAKVLSTGALRARVEAVEGERILRYRASWQVPDGFAEGARISWLDDGDSELEITRCRGSVNRLELDRPPPAVAPGQGFEIRFAEEAPIVAARLVTATPCRRRLPPLALRLASTRGTNALLERRGARTVLFITRGFADLLAIGNQQRPDLFALDIRRPALLYEEVVEVPERLAADGSVLVALELEALMPEIERLRAAGLTSAAVALVHSYRNPQHEQQLTSYLRARGFAFVSASAGLAPLIKILPRAETAVVNAYLMPVIDAYLRRVRTGGRVQVMTSAGGLVRADRFQAKDSLLSGPAGGVVGAALSGRECGFERLIAFDMGGTSTDVSRYDGDYEYLFEHRVGDATVAAPALAIETVAAGGGSICWLEHRQLKVGPRSAGAEPGPACYGAGGPLTLTDVNLLLGRLEAERFGIPIEPAAAERAAAELHERLAGSDAAPRVRILQGFLDIANERMADAVRRISVRRGYDPRGYALVAFGGAGGQHACALAELLGIGTVVLPRDAGLLSALGLGAAVVERFAHRQVLAPLSEAGDRVGDWLSELARQAVEEVEAEGVSPAEIEIRRRIACLRFVGQETAIEVEAAGGEPLEEGFLSRYQARYGYRPADRPIEIESLRVVASSRPPRLEATPPAGEARAARPCGEQRAFFAGSWRRVPVFRRHDLAAGDELEGPALVFDEHSSLVVESGWSARVAGRGAVIATRPKPPFDGIRSDNGPRTAPRQRLCPTAASEKPLC
ncbi:MAG: hydantoinase/oxoprolinase family protein [bacterium]|nr:hydantoinase/oxoprolinase family protein [bacterium]